MIAKRLFLSARLAAWPINSTPAYALAERSASSEACASPGPDPGHGHDRRRPADINDRVIPGHWEGDLILGANNAFGDRDSRRTSHPLRDLVPADGRHTAEIVRDAIAREITASRPT